MKFPVFYLFSGLGFALTAHAQFSLVETGGTFRADDTNLATGGAAFASGLLNGDGYGVHSIAGLNDGVYGNSSSWIGDGAGSAGILFGSASTISSFAFGRDNTGVFADRNAGTYTFYYTTDTGLNAGNALSATWTSLGSLNYFGGYPARPAARHLYNLAAPVANATGFRIASADGTAIDEIELYSTSAVSSPLPPGVSNLGAAATGIVSLYAGDGMSQRFTTDSSGAGFTLDSVRIRMTGYGMNDFTLTLMSDSGTGLPDQVLGVLAGPGSFNTLGDYEFTGSNLMLAPDTSYWLAASFSGAGSFVTYSVTTNSAEGDWDLDGGLAIAYSPDPWIANGNLRMMLSIKASAVAVPEPSACAALAGLAGLGLACARRRRR